jgi:hypothetical protein
MLNWLYDLLMSFVQFVLSFFGCGMTCEKKKVHFDESVKDGSEDNIEVHTKKDENDTKEVSDVSS